MPRTYVDIVRMSRSYVGILKPCIFLRFTLKGQPWALIPSVRSLLFINEYFFGMLFKGISWIWFFQWYCIAKLVQFYILIFDKKLMFSFSLFMYSLHSYLSLLMILLNDRWHQCIRCLSGSYKTSIPLEWPLNFCCFQCYYMKVFRDYKPCILSF